MKFKQIGGANKYFSSRPLKVRYTNLAPFVLLKNFSTGKRQWVLFFSSLAILFPACADSNQEVLQPGQKKYFDLKGFFNEETKRLETFSTVKKIATVDGVREEHVLDSLNFGQELKIFSNADINRPAWSDKYAIDSVFNEQKQLTRLNYTTEDKDLRTRQITVDFEDGQVLKIFIENSTSSAIADTKQLLTYQPASGYTIESKQAVALSKDNAFLVEVQFLKNR
ncbi:MAG: hypothetical protein R2830_02455 [Saprospiraceae bacterium]